MESIENKLRPNHPIVSALAREGSRFQQRLDNWHEQSALHADCLNPHYKLALANYHALQLFLCRNFTYYACWEEEHVPLLAASGVEMHVTAIVVQSDDILKHSKIPGILVLFPLRMGAANANRASQQDQIIKLLERISQNGFIVSERIKVDSQELWEYQRRRSGEI